MLNPSLILIGPIIISAIVMLLRRWSVVSAVVGTIAVWALAALILLFSSGQATFAGIGSGDSWTLLGFTLVYQDYTSVALAFVCIILGFVFLLSLIVPQGDLFVTIGILIISPLAALLFMEPFSTGAIFIIIIGALSAIFIQGKRPGSTLGSIRHLTFTVLAAPLLLLAGWMLDSGQAQYLSSAAYLLLLAILLLLLAFPFQFWLGPNVSKSQSLVPVVLFGLVQFMVTLFCLQMLVNNPVIYGNAQFLLILKASGVATLVIATLLVLTCRSLGRLFGYLVLFDVGVTIIALSLGGRIGLQETIGLLMLRTIALVFCGVGLGLIRAQKSSSYHDSISFGKMAGLARQAPFGVALFVFGCLSLAGAPLTPGFAGRWLLTTMPAVSSAWLSFGVIFSVAFAVAGILRFMPELLSEPAEDEEPIQQAPRIRIVAATLLVTGALITLSPSFILDIAEQLTNQLL